MLSFNEFVASKVFVKNQENHYSDNFTGFVYVEDLCFIDYDESTSSFYLTIGNCQYDGDLDKLERILYDEFYLTECS